MALVSVYVPENVPKEFLNYVVNYLALASTLKDPYVLFDRTESCACTTRDFLAIRGRSILVKKNYHSVVGYPLYALPDNCTHEETIVIATWLLRYRLTTFESGLTADKKFYRVLNKCSILFKLDETLNSCCDTFILEKDPIFILRTILFSAYGQGPVIENVIKNQV